MSVVLGELFPNDARVPQGQTENSPQFQLRDLNCKLTSPAGAAENPARVLHQRLFSLRVQHQRTASVHHARIAKTSLAFSRRHRASKQNDRAGNRRRGRPRSPFAFTARDNSDFQSDATHQRRFVQMDSRNISRPTIVFMAGRIRRVQRERIATGQNHRIHSRAAGASPQNDVSGGIFDVVEKTRR